MKDIEIIIHRGTHQIGGVATEIRTKKARIIIDMGDELCLTPSEISMPLDIDGVTNYIGSCDAVLFTHYHSDHIGQFNRVRADIPMYMGKLAKEIFLASHHFGCQEYREMAEEIKTFEPKEKLIFKDIVVTPYLVDHSASDAYMFLVEVNGKKILHTGDFRLHGFRAKGMLPTIDKYIGNVDAIITEGTNLGRDTINMSEQKLQQILKQYVRDYKYVFLLSSSTNLERVCSAMHSVPKGKYFLCDIYQKGLLEIISNAWGARTKLYHLKKCVFYTASILDRILKRGCLMCVRDNTNFRGIMANFPKDESIILYSLWDGYLEEEGNTLESFLDGWHWEKLHTSGHADASSIYTVIDKVNAQTIIPIHTECPMPLVNRYGNRVKLLEDREILILE